MTGIDGQHILSGLQFIVPSVKFNVKGARNDTILPQRQGPVSGESGGNAGQIAPIPSVFYVQPLSDRLRFVSPRRRRWAAAWTMAKTSSAATRSGT